MSLLAQCAPSRWTDFLSISDDAMPTCSGAETDLFVGKKRSMTITLINGTETRFRDVVVLGELIINSADPTNTALKPNLLARDFFVPGKLVMKNMNVQCRNNYVFKNKEAFRSELKELFLEWINIQREAVAGIGLKSILA